MAIINSDIVNHLCEILDAVSVNWKAFDELLDSIPNINVIDEDEWEETYLSSCIENSDSYHSGEKLAEIIRRFIAKGYDVKANEGKNGGLCLSQLCWSSNDKHIIEAAKVLLSAGAPIDYPSIDDEPDETSGVMGDIEWKISGAWVVDKDYSWANTLESYYQIVKAVEDGKPYEKISTYHECIGKRLDKVDYLGRSTLQSNRNGLFNYTDPLVLWFEGIPLVVSKYVDLVVNPYAVDESRDSIVDVSFHFSHLAGAVLQSIIYLNQSTCYFQFDNGVRINFTSFDAGNRERTGLFEFKKLEPVCLKDANIDAICFWHNGTYADCVIKYEEEVLALFKDTEVILIFTIESENGENYIEAISCSRDFAKEYNQQLPINKPEEIEQLYYSAGLKALRFKCGDYYLYAQAHEYSGFEVKLSQERVIIEEPTLLRRTSGVHMNFTTKE